jgi:hypothetical protein
MLRLLKESSTINHLRSNGNLAQVHLRLHVHERRGFPMKHIVAGLGSLGVVAVVTAALAQTDSWKEYAYTGDGFAVAAPAEPARSSQPIYVTGGTADAHIYTSQAGSNTALMLFVYDRHNNDRRSIQQIHAQAQEGALGAVKGKLRARTELALGKYHGAELEFEAQHPDLDTKTHQVRSRYYVVGRKIYHLLAIAPIGEPFPTDTDRWFKSFRLTTAADH